MVHDTITNFANPEHSVLEEDSAQILSWDILISGSAIHSISWGNGENERTSKDRQGRPQSILRRPAHLMREVISDTTWLGLNIYAEGLCSHGEHIHEHFVVPGTQNFCGARGTIRS